MKFPVLFLLLLVFLIYAIYLTYLYWAHPEEYKKSRTKGINAYKRWFPFLPDAVLTAFFFPEQFGLWWARIMLPLIDIFLLVLLWVAAFGVPIELP